MSTEKRVIDRFASSLNQEKVSSNRLLSVEDVADICLKCAYSMITSGVDAIYEDDLNRMVTGAWESLPKGWTQDSLDKFWDSLTGDVKHKVTKCIKKMEGKIDDPGAFCASIADKVDPGWRSRR